MDKSLHLSWLGRFSNRTKKSCQAILNDPFNRYGGLSFLPKYNYDSELLDKQPEMLDLFKEMHTGHRHVCRSEFILWNNKEITIERKSIFWTFIFSSF